MFRRYVADLRAVEGPAALTRLQERFGQQVERSVKSSTELFRRLGLKACVLTLSPEESSPESS